MAHGRRGRGSHRGATRAGRGNLRSSFVPQSRNLDAHHASPFSLRDEARNTESRHRMWSSDVKLRNAPVAFVSAGNMAGTKPEEQSSPPSGDEHLSEAISQSEDAMAKMNLQSAVADPPMDPAEREPINVPEKLISETTPITADSPPAMLFFEDTAGSKASVDTGLPPPTLRSTSPTPSDSSEEVVLFRGRNAVKTVTESLPLSHTNSHRGTLSANKPRESKKQAPEAKRAGAGTGFKRPNTAHSTSIVLHPTRNPNSNTSHGLKRAYGGRSSKPNDEAIADYLENIRAQEEEEDGGEALYDPSILTQRALGLSDSDEWVDEVPQQKPLGNQVENPYKTDWEPGQLEDFDGISTSSKMTGVVNRILRKRDRQNVTQYLVVFENTDEDEARWLPITRLTQEREQKLVADFEETIANLILGNERSSSESEESEDDGEEDANTDSEDDDDDESFEDEKDLIQRKIDRMSDESIARLLAKQEELGMGSDELLLFDDDDDDDDDDAFDDYDTRYGKSAMQSSRRNQPKSGRGRDSFPSASLMADVLDQDPYNGFDIMDFDRPSLRKKKKKGATADMLFELSDEDLAAQLRSTWETDRKKKSLRKQEREELRAQGLLGKKNKFKPDLKAKYDEGMTFNQIKEEIRTFLNSPNQSRPFPPMDTRDRAIVHQLGNAFNLKSKSVGAGKSRFTTLIKTSRTVEYEEAIFAQVASRYERRFVPRMDKSAAKGKRNAAGGGGGGGRNAAVSYRDGDVVGASAPELGVENKGRAMLEKMGWSSGTALGALNNKGILQPVTHIVKTTKAGLG
ncbi:uncharacterized protein K452DRAFT_245768 [Aplosporella prunicola CBS 121167]|uniref:Protein SQS1 n=1 Tax=Aplosporella prunicola CBS 121167 TaxID=1176127 RepID=A0A6A6BQ42_9PEZI|nr:uncharacterized protein K452DRAFT_245768 [Aplosporella prunicola CBS 121167]KAF2144701.1 hypothetical protein K452DRAFT_245768 [Aplosporella prunicola CBS 121167]